MVEIGKAIRCVRLAAESAGDSLDRIPTTRAVEESLRIDYTVPFERLDDMEFRRTATIAVHHVLGQYLAEVDVVETVRRVEFAAIDAADAFDVVGRTRASEKALVIDFALPLERFDNGEFE